MVGNLTLAAAFVAGVSSSLHCLTMCGGIAGALGMRARAVGQSAPVALLHASTYQLGRISSYAIAGAACGALGGAAQGLMAWLHVAQLLRVLAGLLLMALGLQVALRWRLLQSLEKFGALVWRRFAPLAAHAPSQGLRQALVLGAIWGWLPCGLVYSMLLLGTLGGSAAHGALIMLAFGAGTLPAMLSSNLLASQLARITALKGLRFAGGLLMFVFGIWTTWLALQHGGH